MRNLLLLTLVLIVNQGFSQHFREQFTEANLLTEDGFYGLAIPIWKTLLEEEPDNANLNYKIGRCYLSMGIDRNQALPYLVKASRGIKKTYDPFSADFKGAPVETYYYLGQAYHVNTRLDSAVYFYEQFLAEAGNKHFLRPQAERGMEMCAVARELMADPIDVEITNIGVPINSIYAEYTPIVAFDENTLYFTSRRLRKDSTNEGAFEARTGLYYEDMYVSYRNVKGDWMSPELLGMNSTKQHSSVVSMSSDGQTLYIYQIFNGNGNIYESSFKLGEGWTAPALVGSDVNSAANEYFATITADRQRLYFVSDRKGGEGGKDIWYVQRLPNGEWGKAINMGPPVNSPYDEDAPYFHPDGKTMYFSSTGHRSMGGYDIFYTQLEPEGKWASPLNIGYPVNTTDDDHCYVSTPSGKRAYYSSRGANSFGSTDIYMVDFHEKEEKAPDVDLSAFAVLKGWIFAPKGEELPDDVLVTITDKGTGENKGEARPVKKNGSFVFIIPSGGTYAVNYLWDSASIYYEEITIPPGTQYQELSREIFLTRGRSTLPRAIALKDEVLTEVVRWKVRFSETLSAIPLGSRVLYLDRDSNVLDTAYVSKDGFFEFKRLSGDQDYILQPLVDGVDNSRLTLVLLDQQDEVRQLDMIEVNHVFYEKGKEPEIVERKISVFKVQIGDGSTEIPAETMIKFLDREGNVVYTEIVREDGSFLYHKLASEDYYLEMLTTLDIAKEVVIKELLGSTVVRIIPLSAKDQRTFVSADIMPSKKQVSEYHVRIGARGIPIPVGSLIKFMDEDNNVLFTEVIRMDGVFTFHKLSPDRDFRLELVLTQEIQDVVMIRETVDGELIRTIYLNTEDHKVFTNETVKKEESQYHVRLSSGKLLPAGAVIRFLDDNDKVLYTEIVGTAGSFVFHKLGPDRDYKLELELAEEMHEAVTITETLNGNTVRTITLNTTDNKLFTNTEIKKKTSEYQVRLSSGKLLPASTVIRFLDENGTVLYTEIIRTDGSFTFHRLGPDRDYRLELVLKEAIDENVYITENLDGNTIRTIELNAINNKLYTNGEVEKQVSEYHVRLSSGKLLPAGAVIRFLDGNDRVLYTEVVRTDGTFIFHKLSPDKDFDLELELTADVYEEVVITEKLDGAVVRTITLNRLDSKHFSSGEAVMEVSEYRVQLGSGKEVSAGTVVKFLDERGNVLYTEVVRTDGTFTFHKLSDTTDYRLQVVVAHDVKGPIEIIEQKDTKTLRTIRMIQEETLLYASVNEPVPPALPEERIQGKGPAQEFTIRLDYNMTAMHDDIKFRQMTLAIKKQLAEKGSVQISLEGSASKVPTSRKGGNEALARDRMEAGKTSLYRWLQNEQIDINRILTISEKSLVQGPEYSKENASQKTLFSGYQYFRVIVN